MDDERAHKIAHLAGQVNAVIKDELVAEGLLALMLNADMLLAALDEKDMPPEVQRGYESLRRTVRAAVRAGAIGLSLANNTAH